MSLEHMAQVIGHEARHSMESDQARALRMQGDLSRIRAMGKYGAGEKDCLAYLFANDPIVSGVRTD